jgi:hypothetical protein
VDLTDFMSLADAMGDHMAAQVLERFSQIVRDAIGRRERHVGKQVSDVFMLVFQEPPRLSCPGDRAAGRAEPQFPAVRVGVDDFKCYKVDIAKGAAKFVPVTGGLVQVTDEFGGPLMYDLLKPTHLCMPVDKQNENPGAEAHAGHLMCYQMKLTVPPRPAPAQPKFVAHEVAGANTNFPDARLVAKSVSELRVPAQKDPVP